jgi:hypothetical protein
MGERQLVALFINGIVVPYPIQIQPKHQYAGITRPTKSTLSSHAL